MVVRGDQDGRSQLVGPGAKEFHSLDQLDNTYLREKSHGLLWKDYMGPLTENVYRYLLFD